jgi:hypothetical protein
MAADKLKGNKRIAFDDAVMHAKKIFGRAPTAVDSSKSEDPDKALADKIKKNADASDEEWAEWESEANRLELPLDYYIQEFVGQSA